MTAPANTLAPATPAPRRSFARAGAASTAAAAAATSTTPVADASPEPDPAEPEQTNAAEMLVNVDFDAALQHNSDGLHRGEIITAKPTKGGNGISLFVAHEDGSRASALFMMFDEVKEGGKGSKSVLDKNGKKTYTPNVRGQKAWAELCTALGLVPQEVTKAVIAFHRQETGDSPPIVGLQLMWDFITNGDFLNASFNGEATAAMVAAQQAESAA